MSSKQTAKVDVIGVPVVDNILHFSSFPAPGENENLQKLLITPGGPACNVSAALNRLDAEVTLYGKVGEDLCGERIMAEMKSEGIEFPAGFDSEIETTTVFVLVENERGGGEKSLRSFFHFADADLSELNCREESRDAVFLDGIVALEEKTHNGALELLDEIEGQDGGIAVASNPNLRAGPELPAAIKTRVQEIFSHCQLLVMNEAEARVLTGAESTEKAAAGLFSHYPALDWLAVTREEKGAYLAADGENGLTVLTVESRVEPGEVVDTSGAGDAFTAAFLMGWLENMTLKEAGVFASAASARAVREPGAWNSMPGRGEIDI